MKAEALSASLRRALKELHRSGDKGFVNAITSAALVRRGLAERTSVHRTQGYGYPREEVRLSPKGRTLCEELLRAAARA
jgi:DNA-binding HxlR family transcriptional regulator